MNEHKKKKKTFEELTYNEQAKSITAQINVIVAAIRAHMRRAQTENRDTHQTRLKCIGQLMRAVLRLTT